MHRIYSKDGPPSLTGEAIRRHDSPMESKGLFPAATMRLSWRGLLIAPLPIPLIYSLIFVILLPGPGKIWMFFICLLFGLLFSYGVTICVFLPSLWFLSYFIKLRLIIVTLVGAAWAAVSYVPLAWIMYCASGDNSGPPDGPFLPDLVKQFSEPYFWAFVFAGLATAFLYGVFSRRSSTRAT